MLARAKNWLSTSAAEGPSEESLLDALRAQATASTVAAFGGSSELPSGQAAAGEVQQVVGCTQPAPGNLAKFLRC